MSFFRNLFVNSGKKITTNAGFWEWFTVNQQQFAEAIRTNSNVENAFIHPVNAKLNELRAGYSFLAGKEKDGTIELIITPDGIAKNVAFCEQLVDAAPPVAGWKFTALKKELNILDVNIEMGGRVFSRDTLSFYPVTNDARPDLIEICVVHKEYDSIMHDLFFNGVCIFLDNYLGELHFMTTVDNLRVEGPSAGHSELISIEKLKDYLVWREKEFVEKYSGMRRNTENDTHTSYEAQLPDGRPFIAVINTDAIHWDAVASHPWILQIESAYNGDKNQGLPDDRTYERLNDLEEVVMARLKDADGYINVGRETGDNSRITYFACTEFRKAALVMDQVVREFRGTLNIRFDLFKDKYWQTFERFRNTR